MNDYGNYVVVMALLVNFSLQGVNNTSVVIILSCALSQLVYAANMDISLYYSMQGLVSVGTAWLALKMNTTASKALSILMLAQFLLCFSLVPDWGYSLNSVLQFKLEDFNAMMIIILIALGVASSGQYNNRSDNNS